MVASRKLVEIANLFPVCKFKDKDHLKITKGARHSSVTG